MLKRETKIFLIGAVATSILGSLFLLLATLEWNNDFTATNYDSERKLEFDTPIGWKTGTDSNPTRINFKFLFTTEHEFVVDNPIHYTIQAKLDGPPIIDKIVFLIDTRNINSSMITDENVQNIIEHAKENDSVIELFPKWLTTEDDSIIFERKGFVIMPEEQDFSLTPLTFGKQGEFGPLPNTGTLFSIGPASQKLEAISNIAYLEIWKNTEIDTKLTIGFGILTIALVLFGFSFNSHKNKKNSISTTKTTLEQKLNEKYHFYS